MSVRLLQAPSNVCPSDEKGLGVLLNNDEDGGIVLFHLDSVWQHNRFSTAGSGLKERLTPGTKVEFLMRSFRGETYTMFSEEKIIHQAVALWEEHEQPNNMSHLLKVSLGEENTSKLEQHRKRFMLLVRDERFLACALVRVRGEVKGYLTDHIGVIETSDGEKVLFHSDDVKIYKKDVRERGGTCKEILPINVSVTFDARKIYMKDVREIKYQAIVVLAGSWSRLPFPTLLMTGLGSTAPNRATPPGSTYYYLDQSLPAKLRGKVGQLETILERSGGVIEYEHRGAKYIRNEDELEQWRRDMGEPRHRAGFKRSFRHEELIDTFKSNRMVETELAVKITRREEEFRTWYSPSAWQHGGLRLKKEERDEEGASQAKRRKTS